jgi:hypothetical protein
MRRNGVIVIIGVLLTSLLTGCSPTVGGVGAVRLDDRQNLVGVFGLCKGFGELTTIALYESLAEGGVGDTVISLERVGPAPTEHLVEVPLQNPPSEWQAHKTKADLDPDQAYELRAWSKDQEARVTSFPFRISELRDRPDKAKTVLSKTPYGTSYEDHGYNATFSTPDAFVDDVVSQQCHARR